MKRERMHRPPSTITYITDIAGRDWKPVRYDKQPREWRKGPGYSQGSTNLLPFLESKILLVDEISN